MAITTKLIIDPVSRMEGHLGVEAGLTAPGVAESGGYRITANPSVPNGAEMHGNLFRGFEQIMIGRDPRDAMVICQRI